MRTGKKKIWILSSLHSSEQPKFVQMYEDVVGDKSFVFRLRLLLVVT